MIHGVSKLLDILPLSEKVRYDYLTHTLLFIYILAVSQMTLEGVKPLKMPARNRVSSAIKDKLRQELDRLEQLQIIKFVKTY